MTDADHFAASVEAAARLPLVTAGRMPAADSRVLFVLCSYPRAALTRDAGPVVRLTLGVLDALSRGRLRGHRELYRDHYANPRPLAYLVGLVSRFRIETGLRQPADLVVDGGFAQDLDRTPDGIGKVRQSDLHGPHPAQRLAEIGGGYDTVVLVWPDALGLGWEGLQRQVGRLAGAAVVALTGRRRAFALDGGVRRALALRRFFAYTRLAELALGLCIYPVAWACALADRLRRR